MSKKVLVVEDTEDNRQILRDLLGMAGYEMVEAHDGAEGVAKAAEHKPDLILMDIQMPVMDGYEATRRWPPSRSSPSRPTRCRATRRRRAPPAATTTSPSPTARARCWRRSAR